LVRLELKWFFIVGGHVEGSFAIALSYEVYTCGTWLTVVRILRIDYLTIFLFFGDGLQMLD